MRRPVALVFGFAAVLGVTLACGSRRRPSDPVCVTWFEATKSWTERCGVPTRVVPTVSDARRFQYETYCELSLYSRGASRARLYYETCAEKLAGRECIAGEPVECTAPPGDLANGAGCANDFQCASGWCRRDGLIDETGAVRGVACGTCTERLAIGETCTSITDRCAYGSACVSFVCGALPEEDQRCVLGAPCAPGFQCVYAAGNPRCERRLPADSPCTLSSECAIGLACAGDRGAGELDARAPDEAIGRCRELEQGERCDRTRGCKRGLGCDPDKRICVPIKYVAGDEACDGNVRRCKSGFCLFTNPVAGDEPLAVYGICPVYTEDDAPCEGPTCEPPAICAADGRCKLPDFDTCN